MGPVGIGGFQALETFTFGPGIGAYGIRLRLENLGFACLRRPDNFLELFRHFRRRMNVLQADEKDARAKFQRIGLLHHRILLFNATAAAYSTLRH